ncbi:thioredoxin-dependent thiol peroxidase [Candidatus Gracilibacteria bacterium]|nr:thioredoxin-dependent thiol peroxidase [Candidatus Gracilibacteria bacterium]
MKAKNFSLADQEGKVWSLEDFKGKWLVIYFYPKDMTPGCTVEAEQFRDFYEEFKALGAEIVGVSCDSADSHKKFVCAHNLPFALLADTEKKMVEDYGVWVEKSMYGKKFMGISRETFVVSPEGEIVKHFEKVKPEGHAEEVLQELRGKK